MKLFDEQRPAPKFERVPEHIALVMDGNGRWANQRGLTRTEGHRAGEPALLDVVAGAIEAGVTHLTAYAFSTENWKRSPDEVKFLMGFNRDVLRRRRDMLDQWNVRIRWIGRRARLWPSVIKELDAAQQQTKNNTGLTLTMAVNYGGRQEIIDAAQALVDEAAAGKRFRVSEKLISKKLYQPQMPEVDLLIRSSGEMRLSNYLLWEASYAELIFRQELWPEFSRELLWECISEYSNRSRRFGKAVDAPLN